MTLPSVDAIYSAASAMNALSTGMAAAAHNVANVNTAGFRPQDVTYATGPNDQGVQAQVLPPSTLPLTPLDQSAANAADTFLPPEALNPSGTDISREFVDMISAQRAYEANAVTVRSWDESLGVLLDIKV